MSIKNRKTFLQRLNSKYRLVILDDENLQEQLSWRLSRMNVYVMASTLAVLFAIVIVLLIIYTPLKEYIPGYVGYDKGEQYVLRKKNIVMAKRVDSLENVIDKNFAYIENIRNVLNGDFKRTDAAHYLDTLKHDDSIDLDYISPADSSNRAEYENADIYDLNKGDKSVAVKKISLFFFKPVEGIVTQEFDRTKNHYGIDIVAQENATIKACLDGVIIMDTWTFDTGYVIAIQHENNLISFYKHCSTIFKKSGSIINAGDAIGIVGNSGELSTGPHCHFEIWSNGKAVNPKDYLAFN